MSEYNNPSHEEMNAQEQASQSTGGSTSQGRSGDAASGQELVDELERLGNKLAEVLRTAWASDERKRMEQDLRTGFNNLASNLEQGVRKMGEHEQTKEFVRKAEEVAETVGEKVRNSQTTYDVASTLASGLRVLADQVEKLATELQRKRTDVPPTPAADNDDSQDIPIGRV